MSQKIQISQINLRWVNYFTLHNRFLCYTIPAYFPSFRDCSQNETKLYRLSPRVKILVLDQGGQPARNTYFGPKIIAFSKKKGLHLESVSTLDSLPSAGQALLYKVPAACDRQHLCKIVPRARSWTTLF